MTYEDPVKYSFDDFGAIQIDEVTDLLQSYKTGNSTKYFQDFWYDDEIKPAFNTYSGYVFLTNSDYQTAMMNDGKIDIHENCPECGQEGFPEEFKDMMGDCEGCQEINKRYEEAKEA